MPPPHPAARPGELRECYYNRAEWGSRSLLAANTTQQECCCTVGEGWGLGVQYQACPPADTGEGHVIKQRSSWQWSMCRGESCGDQLQMCLCCSWVSVPVSHWERIRHRWTGSLQLQRYHINPGSGPADTLTKTESTRVCFSPPVFPDVDECKRFHPEVCKNGVCVNNIPGYSCYCSSGYVYDSMLLECVGTTTHTHTQRGRHWNAWNWTSPLTVFCVSVSQITMSVRRRAALEECV